MPMMNSIRFYLLISAVTVLAVTAVERPPFFEFGRAHAVKGNQKRTISPNIKVKSFMLEEEALFAFSMSLSMSMSMSMSFGPSKAPSGGGSTLRPTKSNMPSVNPTVSLAPSISMQPSNAPSVSHAPSISMQPSNTPTMSHAPSISMQPSNTPTMSHAPSISMQPSNAPSVSHAPSISMQPSNAPSISHSPTLSFLPSASPTVTPAPSSSTNTISPAPTPSAFQESVVFTCTAAGVDVVPPPHQAATVINIRVGYLVETLAFPNVFLADLERKILSTAVTSALQCNSGGPAFAPGNPTPPVAMFTALTGEPCTPQISVCSVMETAFQFVVDTQVDPEVAAVLSYVSLQQEMDGGVFVAEIPLLDRVKYLSPLPLLPPIQNHDDDNAQPIVGSGSVAVSSWTIGAVVAVCVGGLAALMVWARNRRTRHRRHMQLLEDMSVNGPATGESQA